MRGESLTLVNRTTGNSHRLRVTIDGVPDVVEWYGAFYAGDDYDVYLNGRKLRLGTNGEKEGDTIDMTILITEKEDG